MGERRIFSGREIQDLGRIARHLRRGGEVVADGPWAKVVALHEALWKRRGELVDEAPGGRATGRQWERARKSALERLLIPTPEDLRQIFASETHLPVSRVIEVREALREGYPVKALGGAQLLAPPPVLPPRSQETYLLVRQAVENCREAGELPPSPTVLDLGCGCGVCGLVAAGVLGPSAAITASDILPMALETTKMNAARLGVETVTVTGGGDLFAPVAGRRFDLVIFNPPWSLAPVRAAGEEAVSDPDRRLLHRFLAEVGRYLNPEGRCLLVYSATSGPGAMADLEEKIAAAGLLVRRRHTDRIKTHRRRRAWQAVAVYELAREPASDSGRSGRTM